MASRAMTSHTMADGDALHQNVSSPMHSARRTQSTCPPQPAEDVEGVDAPPDAAAAPSATAPLEAGVVNESITIPQAPAGPARPTLAYRQYSAHVYALPPRSPMPGNLPSNVQEPEAAAHITRRVSSDVWPLETAVTVRPSESQLQRVRALRRPSLPSPSVSDFSVVSGISCEEVASPSCSTLQTVEDLGPGTKCMIKDVDKYWRSFDNTDESLEGPAEIKVRLERVTTFEDKIATKERLHFLMKEYPMPAPKHGEPYNFIRYQLFSTYRRLFTLVTLVNIALIIWAGVRASRDSTLFTYGHATTAVAVNLFLGVMMRHEHSVNMIFRVLTALPLCMPLAIRRQAAKVYAYGGIHSSCGVGAFMWYVFFAVLVINNFAPGNDGEVHGLAVILACMIFVILTLIVMSYPGIRQRFHNQWEMSHRFGGWTAVGLTWAQTFLISLGNARTLKVNAGIVLITTPAFWLLIAITGSVIYPWIRLRHRVVSVEPLSTHATRLHIHHDKNLPSCKGIKLAHSPLLENHAFATIPNPNGEKGYSIIVANNGDWTKELIKNPPKKLWIKGAPVSGVMCLSFLFRRIVVVATGSGIGPCMSLFNAHPNWDVRIIWAARFPATSFGNSTVESVLAADPNALLVDTKKTGKEGLTEICYGVYKQSKAEAVVIISNPTGTKEVVYALETRGVPAYGAIWDS